MKSTKKQPTMKDVNNFEELVEQAKAIGKEAVEYIQKKYIYTKKREGKEDLICRRDINKLREMFYKKYPEAKTISEKERDEKCIAILEDAIKDYK